jgi:alpha-ketoglutarate-dependent 2,4-dichlorophenoxyacetate dioxygenase
VDGLSLSDERASLGTMTLTIIPRDPARPDFAGEVQGIDLRKPLTPDEVAAVAAGMDRYAVLVFRDQDITDAQQYAFSCHFGPMETATGDIAAPQDRRLSMDIGDISNLDKNGKVLARDDRRRLFSLGNQLWHSDSSFKPTPAKYSALSARVIPGEGGNTEFADMRAAWDTLDQATKDLVRDMVTVHSQIFSRGTLGFTDFTDEERVKWAPVRQRLVRRHESSGRLSLYLSAHIGGIEGWPVPEARALLRDLTEHATQRQFVYAHVWRPHDLVMWDNRAMMHRARRYDATQVRDLHRTTNADSAPTLEQPGP